MAQLLDQWGRPLDRKVLTQEVAAPTLGGVRTPMAGYPADGLDPRRLADIMRGADQGDPVRYLELAEAVEERDLHYQGVLGTRKRAISQLDITVKPGGESTKEMEMARMVEDWLDRDELTDELFNVLDGVGKGFSFMEIIWEMSSGQYLPARLEYRDPRWFRFAKHDLATPMLLSETGQEEPLPGFKFIFARMQAKSGLPLRGGLARAVAWAYLFKRFTERDWAIFTQTYGQPIRVGKFGPGASEEDKNALFRAVANVAGDMAAIIPESMMIDFVEAANLGAGHTNYRERADWLDRQVSKAVLGQTATTDAEVGGLGSGKEHGEVRADIERADAKQLAAALNRDLIRVWIDLEYGPQPTYPKLVIGRPEKEDLVSFSSAITPLISAGLRVRQQDVRDKFGLTAPEDDDEIFGTAPSNPPKGADQTDPEGSTSPVKRQNGPVKRSNDDPATDAPEAQSEAVSSAKSEPATPEAAIADRLALDAVPTMAGMIDRIAAMVEAAGSMEELREMMLAGFGDVDDGDLREILAAGFAASLAAGRASIEGTDG